jgi:hypothetical protein
MDARRSLTRIKVRVLLDQGLRPAEVARVLAISPPTVCYHRRRLGHRGDDRSGRRYDWMEIQAFYDAGHSVRECIERFGFSRQAWHEAVGRGTVVPRPAHKGIEHYLVAGGELRTKRSYLKRRLIAAGLKQDRCEECGVEEWQGKPISLPLHHINGNGSDNRLENLQILCPNCHSQTPNFAGRNNPRKRSSNAAE